MKAEEEKCRSAWGLTHMKNRLMVSEVVLNLTVGVYRHPSKYSMRTKFQEGFKESDITRLK